MLYVTFILVGYYFSSILEIKWRRWLSIFYLNSWFKDKTYYKFKLFNFYSDNPDQKISEDIRDFIVLTYNLFIGIFKAILNLSSFMVLLWHLSGNYQLYFLSNHICIPGYMVWVAILYSLIGTYIIFKLGEKLVALNYEKEMYEANFRYNLVRAREYTDHIAAYNGEELEKETLTKNLENVVDNFMQRLKRNLKINAFSFVYMQITNIIPIIISIGRYFSKEITLGGMMQITSAFGQVQGAISYFIFAYPTIANWRAVSNRLLNLNQSIENTKSLSRSSAYPTESSKKYLELEKLHIMKPNGDMLIRNFSMSLYSGDRVLIQGITGCGKTTLLKTMNGLWPYYSGKIYKNPSLSSLFIFQKPYFSNTNLKKNICYPKLKNLPGDDEIIQLLKECKLMHLSDKLHETFDWSNYLSLGEQQKIAFCRVIINQPDLIYLDEITAALDEDSEKYLYAKIISFLPKSVIISVGRPAILMNFHNKVSRVDR